MPKPAPDDPVFQVHRFTHLLGGVMHRTASLWVALGKLESKQLEERLRDVAIDRPIYVCSLARAGTTILLELLASHPKIVSHQYQDYPSVFTPAWWTGYLERQPARRLVPVERAQQDGIVVTAESPEAMEEMLWMRFFPDAHRPTTSSVLDARTERPTFESFYRDHLRKLLLVRRGNRYLAKGNYNITRLEYLLRLFPDARFVIPVRHPVSHVASLMRQHRRFCRGVDEEPRALAHLQRIGHFEFGPDFRPINTGDDRATEQIAELVQTDPPRGWARYWSQIFSYLRSRLRANRALREATLLVPFEQLCRHPRPTLSGVLAHAEVAPSEPLLADYAARIRVPDYYDRGLSAADVRGIWQECEETATWLGYIDDSP
jgi:hypothetical protein